MENYEKETLRELTDGKRFLAILSNSSEAIDFALKNNLEYVLFLPENTAYANLVVAPKKNILDVITLEKIREVGLPQYEEKALEFLVGTRNLSLVQTFLKLQNYFEKHAYSVPSIDLLYGILFGYKPCDIAYYIHTRVEGAPPHRYEDILTAKIGEKSRKLKEQHVMCEKCTQEYLAEKS